MWFVNFIRIKLFSLLSGEESFAKSKLSRGVTLVVLYPYCFCLFHKSKNLETFHPHTHTIITTIMALIYITVYSRG